MRVAGSSRADARLLVRLRALRGSPNRLATVPQTVLDVLRKATDFFDARGLDTPRLDAEVLLAHGLRVRRLDLYLQHDRPLTEAELSPLRRLVQERGRGVPVAYLTGEKEFFSLP